MEIITGELEESNERMMKIMRQQFSQLVMSNGERGIVLS